MFCDYAKITVFAGKGGDGAISFLHEKDRPRGGPDGGDGGRGGDIIFAVDPNINTLTEFICKKKFVAPDGEHGGTVDKHGKDGEDLIVDVPLGTIVYEIMPDGQREAIVDFSKKNQTFRIARGGKGGFGNAHFTSSVRQVPQFREIGLEGQKKKLIVELKTIADVGLVGLPNCGKSTFLSVVTKARPKIANYPFTTLEPNLGVMYLGKQNLIVADIPGLIEGASEGKGLGHDFLKHIERTRLIIHFIDIQSLDPVKDYYTIQNELKTFSKVLAKKPFMICFTKIDTVGWKFDDPQIKDYIKDFKKEIKYRGLFFAISSATHSGLDFLTSSIFHKIKTLPIKNIVIVKKAANSSDLPDKYWKIKLEKKGTYRLLGEKIEQFAKITEFDSPEGLSRLKDIIQKMGILSQLQKKGFLPGHTVVIGAKRFIW